MTLTLWTGVVVLLILCAIIWLNYDNIMVNIVNFMTVKRGLVYVDKFWWGVSSFLLPNDSAGVKLYRYLKAKHGKYVPLNLLGVDITLLTDQRDISFVLAHSPDPFCVGTLKYKFFKPFMEYNVGVSNGCPWKKRRVMNEAVLSHERLHPLAGVFNRHIGDTLRAALPTNFDEFLGAANRLSSLVVFGRRSVPPEIYETFEESNCLSAMLDKSFSLPSDLSDRFRSYIWENIQHARPSCLVNGSGEFSLTKAGCIDQVPHWIFPVRGVVATVAPRVLALLANDPRSLRRLRTEMRDCNVDSAKQIYACYFLRACVLECLRLNNLVTSTFRSACTEVVLPSGGRFNKGSQFLILNHPLLRRATCFKSPNAFRPQRWNKSLEKEYCSMMFNQGPQECPGKELSIFLVQSIVAHYLARSGALAGESKLKSNTIDLCDVPQLINPCTLTFEITS